MMSHVEYTTSMYDAPNTPEYLKEERGVLTLNINKDCLGFLYT